MIAPPALSVRTRRYLAFRRALELSLIVVVAPVVLAVSVLVCVVIWLEDRGPVLFIQWRPGRAGRPFRLVKFRSMRTTGADAAFRLATDRDPRVTHVGRALRRLHLDELPQLWNVVRGDMSLIGPRPVPLELYEKYLCRIAHYDWRHSIRPGLLGKAQVELGYTDDLAGERDKWLLDMEYVNGVGWRLDGHIVLVTLRLARPGTGDLTTRNTSAAA